MAVSLPASAPSDLPDPSGADDFEYAFVRMLEVRVHWGDQLLSLHHLRAGSLVLGDGTAVPIPGLPRLEVARMSSRGPEVCDPAHATWSQVPAEGSTFAIGAFTVSAVLTNECKAPAQPAWSWSGVWQLALSFALHAVVLVVLANLVPAFADPDAPVVDDRVDTMRRLLAVADEKALELNEGRPPASRVVRTSQPTDDSEYYGPSAYEGNGNGFMPRTRLRFTRGGGGVRIRQGVGMAVNGRIPAEVVNRIVRQNYGRFRLCYETARRSHPDLAGTVVTRFVIDRSGAVSIAQDGGSSLPNRSAVACVVRGFSNLSFPQPEGGIVTVSYPVVFSLAAEG